MKDEEEPISDIKNHFKSQGIKGSELELCLDTIRLVTCFDFEPATIEELKQSQAFVAYSYGIDKRKDGKPETLNPYKIQYDPRIYAPGKTNEGLAKVIMEYYTSGIELPVFSQ